MIGVCLLLTIKLRVSWGIFIQNLVGNEQTLSNLKLSDDYTQYPILKGCTRPNTQCKSVSAVHDVNESDVQYCHICGLPLEYCGDVQCPRLRALPVGNVTSHTDISLSAQSPVSAKNMSCPNEINAEPPPDAGNGTKRKGGKAGKAAQTPVVTIKLTLRGSKKFVTTVTVSGLEAFLPLPPPGGGGPLKDAARLLANSLAACASVVKCGPAGGGESPATTSPSKGTWCRPQPASAPHGSVCRRTRSAWPRPRMSCLFK